MIERRHANRPTASGPEFRTVFFPDPPAFVVTPGAGESPTAGRRGPVESRPFLGETFFPSLSALAELGRLDKKLAAELAEHLALEERLASELRNTLASTRHQSTETRSAILTALAAKQAPGLERLELAADKLATRLRSGGFASAGFGWDDLAAMQARLQGRPHFNDYEYVRALRFLAEGFSRDQRALLGEILTELLPDATSGPTVGFHPLGTRIPLPETLTPATATALRNYLQSKEALKGELLEHVLTRNPRRDLPPRAGDLRKLARQQAPAFERLAELAETVRRQLWAESPPAVSPWDLATSPDRATVADYLDACHVPGLSAAQRELLQRRLWAEFGVARRG